jgi:hypothetical protein
MTARRSALFYAVQLAWEFVRFFGLFALLLFRFRPALLDDPLAILWLVALGSTQLLVPAGLLFLVLDAGKRAILVPFVRLGKILQLFPVLLLLFALPFSRGLPHLPLTLLPPRLSTLPFLLAGVLVDLIFLFSLFAPPASSASPPAHSKPQAPSQPPGPPANEAGEGP